MSYVDAALERALKPRRAEEAERCGAQGLRSSTVECGLQRGNQATARTTPDREGVTAFWVNEIATLTEAARKRERFIECQREEIAELTAEAERVKPLADLGALVEEVTGYGWVTMTHSRIPEGRHNYGLCRKGLEMMAQDLAVLFPPEPEAPAAPSGVRYYVHLDGRVWGITDDREWWCQVIPVEDAAFVAALLAKKEGV